MAILQEFDLEIKPMRLVRGQGLSKMMADNQVGHEKKCKFNSQIDENNLKKMIVSQVDIDQGVVTDIWYQDIVYYLLQDQLSNWMNSSQCRGLKMKCDSYMLHDRKLYKRNYWCFKMLQVLNYPDENMVHLGVAKSHLKHAISDIGPTIRLDPSSTLGSTTQVGGPQIQLIWYQCKNILLNL